MTELCEYCNRDDLSSAETIDHARTLLRDYALLQALIIVNGPDFGKWRYLEVGGLIHMHQDEITGGVR